MNPEVRARRLETIATALNVAGVERHIFLCAEQSTPRCAPYETTARVWRHLKRRLKELDLASPPPHWQGVDVAEEPPATTVGDGCVLRTKADCLRICESGPIAVVYPDGTWYHSVDEAAIDRIIDEHLVAGTPVADLVFARGELGR